MLDRIPVNVELVLYVTLGCLDLSGSTAVEYFQLSGFRAFFIVLIDCFPLPGRLEFFFSYIFVLKTSDPGALPYYVFASQ